MRSRAPSPRALPGGGVPVALVAGALAALLGSAGCSTPPRPYPDLGTPESAYHTYVRAWRTGDLEVLEQSITATPLDEFHQRREDLGDEGLRDFYRRDAENVEFGDPEVETLNQMYAGVTVPAVIRRAGAMNMVWRFEFVRVGDRWKYFRLRARPVKTEEDG